MKNIYGVLEKYQMFSIIHYELEQNEIKTLKDDKLKNNGDYFVYNKK